MISPPAMLDGARVLRLAIVDDTVRPTGRCVHRFHPTGVMGPAAALAICQYDGEQGYYLVYCDGGWKVVTDGCHESVETAMRQAELEYIGISFR